jgi:hypothetical protein
LRPPVLIAVAVTSGLIVYAAMLHLRGFRRQRTGEELYAQSGNLNAETQWVTLRCIISL